MPLSSWLIGEVLGDGSVFTTNGGGGGDYDTDVPSGLYLYDTTSALSWLTTLASAVQADNPDLSAVSFTLTRGGYVHLQFDDTTDVTMSAAVAEILGFTSTTLTGDDEYFADNQSTHLWVPMRTEVSDMRLGTSGAPVYDAQYSMGGGQQRPKVTVHNSHRKATLGWRSVANRFVWLMDETGGTYFAFWRNVLMPGRQFTHYRGVTTVEGDTADASLVNRVGPYCHTPPGGRVEFPYSRVVKNVEHVHDIDLPCVLVNELV